MQPSAFLWSSYPFFAGAVYENPPVCPTIFSTAIEWEQSIIEGHPTHPVRPLCFIPFNTYMLNLSLTDASGSSRSSTALMSRSAKQGLETSTNLFRCGVLLDARHCRPL